MVRVRLLAGALVLFGSCLLAPGPQPIAWTKLHLAQGRPGIASHGLPPRLSAGGYFYGECGGSILAVFLNPEPRDQRQKPIAEAAPSPGP
jgi:hypothetical protein